MVRAILLYGAVGALIAGGFMVAGMLLWPTEDGVEGGALAGYLVILLALSAVFLGIKSYRDASLGGVIKFLPALLLGLGISAVASLGWVIGWEISLAATDFDFGAVTVQTTADQMRARGASEEEIANAVADTTAFVELYMSNPLVRAPITFIEMFPIGALVALISAALLRNSRFLPARPSIA